MWKTATQQSSRRRFSMQCRRKWKGCKVLKHGTAVWAFSHPSSSVVSAEVPTDQRSGTRLTSTAEPFISAGISIVVLVDAPHRI